MDNARRLDYPPMMTDRVTTRQQGSGEQTPNKSRLRDANATRTPTIDKIETVEISKINAASVVDMGIGELQRVGRAIQSEKQMLVMMIEQMDKGT